MDASSKLSQEARPDAISEQHSGHDFTTRAESMVVSLQINANTGTRTIWDRWLDIRFRTITSANLLLALADAFGFMTYFPSSLLDLRPPWKITSPLHSRAQLG
ncbi:hypothetical protein DFH09DRAFT_1309009 [Mycena vulgaris]|nr:hypothetical protein DFH09DRAFT_1309009 [Mycena vulgaris]